MPKPQWATKFSRYHTSILVLNLVESHAREFLAAKNTVAREYFKFSTRVVNRVTKPAQDIQFRRCVLSY